MSLVREAMGKPVVTSVVPGRFPGKIAQLFCRGLKILAFLSLSLYFLYVLHNSVSPSRMYPDCVDLVVGPQEVADESASSAASETTNITHVVFGIGASLKTWGKRRRYSELWWRPSEMRGLVWLDRKPKWWPKKSPPYRVSEDVSGKGYKGSKGAVRLARIVTESYRLRWKGARWFVMGDDDTVFVPENLVAVLSRLDHREMWYVGAPSESVEQAMEHGYDMAYGGGGFALSAPAAEAVAGAIDGCLARYGNFYGSDGRVRACMSELGVPLTRQPGFHQVDIQGDAYGLLAAHPVAPFISLHHLDAVKPLIPFKSRIDSVATIMEAARLDPAQAMQQTFCYDPDRNWSISVSWGYTVQIYPSVVPAYLLETSIHTFRSWRGTWEGPFTFNTRPIPADPCMRPAIFFLHRVENVSSSLTMTWYRRFVYDSRNLCRSWKYPSLAIHDVRVASFKMPASSWKKAAARRRCCDVKSSTWRGIINVRARKCGHGETITAPSQRTSVRSE